MIQVLERSFQILELVAAEPDRDCALGEIARTLGLHPATCSHIVKTLMAGGYLEQDAPGKGYRLGPTPYALTRRGPYRKDLVSLAQPHLVRLAGDLGESVEFSLLRGRRRVVLAHIDGGGAVRIREGLVHEDNPYATASGRLLLAHLPAEPLEALIQSIGLPGEAWPGAATRAALDEKLARIRREGYTEILKNDEVVGIAYPVSRGLDGPPFAALGLHLPAYRYRGSHKKQLHAALKAAAREITSELGATAPERNIAR